MMMSSIEGRFKSLRQEYENASERRFEEIAKLDDEAEHLREDVFQALQHEFCFLNEMKLSIRKTSQWIFIDHAAQSKLIKIYPDLNEKRWCIEPNVIGAPIQLTVEACLESIATIIEILDRKLQLRTFEGG
jgi:hypothetical protein